MYFLHAFLHIMQRFVLNINLTQNKYTIYNLYTIIFTKYTYMYIELILNIYNNVKKCLFFLKYFLFFFY